MTTKYLFHQERTAFKLEVFVLCEDPFGRERFRRRVRREFEGQSVFIPTAEDVLVQKLRWGRRKDREDVAAILHVSGDGLDWPYIYRWVDQHGTRDLLEQIRSGDSDSADSS